LAQSVVYLALAPKSNSLEEAYIAVKGEIKKSGSLATPLHIRNAPTSFMKSIGYGKGYKYAHDFPNAEVEQEHMPEKLKGKFENRVFGCDICQDVCPWNKFSSPHNETEFLPSDELLSLTAEDWHALTEDKFTDLFENSAIKRTGFIGLSRNLLFIK
jgi:ferredoxin